MRQTPSTRETIAGNVRAELARANLSAIDLADHLGVTPETVRRKLACRSELTGTELVAIAGLLGLTLDQLTAGAGRATQPADVPQLPGQSELLTREDVHVALGVAR